MTSELLQALGQMNFFGKGEVMGLEDAETDCTHQVYIRLMLSSLQHLDNRAQVDERDYQYDPNTGVVQKSCPKCNYYLRDFLIHIMEVTNFYPATKRFFCSSCLVTKKLPPVKYSKLKVRCIEFKIPVHQSFADMITFLVCCLSKQVGEQEPEAPVSDTQDPDDIEKWMQELSSVVMTLWNQE